MFNRGDQLDRFFFLNEYIVSEIIRLFVFIRVLVIRTRHVLLWYLCIDVFTPQLQRTCEKFILLRKFLYLYFEFEVICSIH